MVSNAKLLHCLRNTLRNIKETEDEMERGALVGAVDQILNILLLRDDREFYANQYAQGLALLKQGQSLASSSDVDLTNLPPQLAEGLSGDAMEAAMAGLSAALVPLVNALPSTGSAEATRYLESIADWEAALYGKANENVPQPSQDILPEARFDKDDFERYLRDKFPEWQNLKVTRFNRIPGGFSKSTILVETNDDVHGSRAMVIRAMQASYILKLHAYRIVYEYPIVKLAYEAGVPVAEPLWLEDDPSRLGTTFFVSRRMPGKVEGTALGPEGTISESSMRSLLSTMVSVHNVNLKAHQDIIASSEILSKWYPYKTVAEATRARNAYWRELTEDAGATHSPMFARAFKWLDENVDAWEEAPTLVHGDFGLHNILIDNHQVTALLDWEIAHIGDPASDLSWLYACTGKQFEPATMLAMYRELGGREISEFSLRYQQVFHCVMMPVTCYAAQKLFDTRLDNIFYANFGLTFLHYNTSFLNQAIAAAEACRRN